MKFLIDGHRSRVHARKEQWPEGVLGQLITPLTRYARAPYPFAIDNGAFTKFNLTSFRNILRREQAFRAECLFVAVPDAVGDHSKTLELWQQYHDLCDGWRKAFVAQDGFDVLPVNADALFIGGTNKFKDSDECLEIVRFYAKIIHVHVGRINGAPRYLKFADAGAHTCDGSGVSRYDHMLPIIREAVCSRN